MIKDNEINYEILHFVGIVSYVQIYSAKNEEPYKLMINKILLQFFKNFTLNFYYLLLVT